MQDKIIVLGAGRMGAGIALSFIMAGKEVVLIDFKSRGSEERQCYTLLISPTGAEGEHGLNGQNT